MPYVLIDTNIFIICSLLTRPDHTPDLISQILELTRSGTMRLLLPETVTIEYRRNIDVIYRELADGLKKAKDKVESAIPDQIAYERQQVVTLFDKLIAAREKSKEAGKAIAEELFTHGVEQILLSPSIMLAAYRRGEQRHKPYNNDRASQGVSADCVIVESVIEVLRNLGTDKLIVCSDNIDDFALFDHALDKHVLHPEIAADMPYPVAYYRSLPEMLATEFGVGVKDADRREYESIAIRDALNRRDITRLWLDEDGNYRPDIVREAELTRPVVEIWKISPPSQNLDGDALSHEAQAELLARRYETAPSFAVVRGRLYFSLATRLQELISKGVYRELRQRSEAEVRAYLERAQEDITDRVIANALGLRVELDKWVKERSDARWAREE